jgi:hypothetical protein
LLSDPVYVLRDSPTPTALLRNADGRSAFSQDS